MVYGYLWLTVCEESPRVATLELREGRFHQVKRMMASQGCTVTRLHRASFGELELGGLPVGEVRVLTREELELVTTKRPEGAAA